MVVVCICNVKSFVLWDVAAETKGYCLFWKAIFFLTAGSKTDWLLKFAKDCHCSAM